MTALLLDTHAWIWFAAGNKRLAKHERLLNRAANAKVLLLSTMSLYEAALIGLETERGVRRGVQAVKMHPTVHAWLRDATRGTGVTTIAPSADVTVDAATFQSMHGDPFDRLIVATAIAERARLVTADAKIIAFAKHVSLPVLELV